MAFNITAIMNVALASGAATKISRDINKALQNKRVTVDLSLANPDSIKRIRADIEGAITSVESFGRQAGLAAKRFGAFSLAAGSMITLVGAIKSSTAEAISFDREMVRLGQVSNDSVASIQAVGNEVTRLSVALGVSSKDLIGAAVTLKQANLSIDDTKIALEALAKAALAPNFENFANTTQGAIAVLNQFKIGAAGLEAALGSVNAVAGEYAVEASDLVEVIRKTGGAFKSAGGDLNELLALFTSVRQTTRESAETISTGLRTIFTRIQRGQTIESLKELGIQLRYTSQEAAALGNIKLADQFVGPYEAVRRLSEALAGIPTTSGKYSAIVEELGGYRQISKVIPLLQEFSVSQGALNVALGGSSSLAANAAQAQNAYIIKIQKIKEEFNALIRSVTQSSGFQKIFDTFISGASAAIQLADALKFLLPLITAIAAVKLATSFGQFVKGFATGVTASPNPKIFNQNRVAEGGYIKMKNGGVVPGSGSGDKVKALLEPGELVIPKKYVGGGTVPVNDMSSLAIQRRLNDPTIPDSNYVEGKSINKSDKFKYEIVTVKIDGGPNSLKGDYKQQGNFFEIEAERQLNAFRFAKTDDRGSNSPVDLVKNGFPYEVKNVATPVSDASIVDKLARFRFETFGDAAFKNSSKGDETINLGQIGLVYNTAKMKDNKSFENVIGTSAGEENAREKYAGRMTTRGNVSYTKPKQAASGGFMIPGTGNTDSFPMDLDEGSFVVRKSSVAKLGAENLHSMSRKGYAKGGKVPALLMPGEFVFSPSSAKSIGSANLERMNKHAKFAAGGRVGLAAGGNPIGEEAYTVASQTQVQVPKFQKIQEFVQGFPDLTAAQASLEAIILEEVKAFRANLSETQKLAEASRIAADVMRRYEDIDNAIKAQEAVIANRSSTATQPEIEADAAELRYLKKQRGALSKEVGLTNVGLPTGDIQSRTKIGTGSTIEVGKGKEYDYAINEKINISDEIRNRAREKAVKISPSGDGENIASVTKIRLAAEEESKLRKQLILAIGEQLRITTGITDQEVLSEMAVEKFTIAMQQNAKLAKDSEGKLLGLVSLEQDIVDSGIEVDQSMRGVSQELKVGSTAIGKLKLSIRSIDDALVSAGNEFVEEMRRGGGGIRGTYAALTNSRLGRIGTGIAGAGLAIGGQYIASTAGTAEDVDKGLVSANRNIYSSGVGEGINQAATTAIALSMIPVAGPFLAVIGGATAFLLGFGSAVKKAQLELLKLQVDKQAKSTSEKLVELKNFSGLEREQKGTAAFTDVRATVFNLRKTAASEGFSGAKLEEEVRAKSLEKFGSNLGAISEELSNAIANMVKPDDQRKSSDIFNEFKQTTYGQLAIESLGVASGKSATEVQKHALTLASSAITAKKLEEAQKNLVIVHEKITLRINTLSNSVNLAAESFRNISDSIGSFSDKLEGRSEFKIQQNTSRLKIGTDAELFNKEADKVFVPFGELGDSVKNQAKELNAFALELPSAFDAAKEKNRDNLGGNLANLTEQNLIEKLKPQGGKFTSTQKDLFDLFKNVLETKETDIKKGGVTGDKITKEALGQTIAEYEGLLQSNAQALNQVTQSYISGLRRISEEQKKYIQEFDKISDKSLSVNKANAAIQARAVRGNPEDFLTKEQRIAPFVERQQNITAGKMEVGGIQDPQTIFDNIKKAAEALEESDKELQASNADLASSNVDAREKARGIAEKNDNLRNVVSSLGDALRNLRDETVTLAEAESRLTKAEKDRENKLSVTENLLTMDRAGKRNLRRGKEAAEQVAGGANLEDMSLKQRKAFFEYTKLYGNIKLPELGGKTGEQVRQVALERASGGQGVPVGEENKKIDEALKDIKEITIKQKEAAELYARLIKTENASQIDKLKGVNNDFIKELKNLLITEFNRGVTGQIGVDKIAQDNLKAIEKDPNFKNYTEIIGKGENKQNREKEFPKVFAQENLQNIADDNARLKNYKEFLPFLQRAEKKTNSRDALSTDLNEQKKGFAISFGGLATPVLDDPKNRGSVFAARRDVEEKIKALEMKIANASGPFSPEQVGQFQPAPSVAAGGSGIPGGLNGVQRGDELAGLLLVAEKLRNANTSIDKLPKAIDLLTKAIEDLQKRLKKPEEKANGGFIGRSMGGSIYNNPTKDIAQRDKYPTYLSEGEFVVNKEGARNNRSELELMNKGHKVGYFDEGGRLTQADIDKSRRETLEERARIANNKASMTGSSVKKQSVITQYSSYPYKNRDGIFNRKDFIDTFGEKNGDYSNGAEDIAWEAFRKFESNTDQPKKFPRNFISVSEGVNPISKEDIDLMMKPSSPKSMQDKKDLLLSNIKKMEESKEYKEKELKVKEKYNLTDLKMPEGFKFEGYEKHLDKIRPDRTTGKKGRKDEDITDINDVKYTIADIRLEFERAVSDLAYVNAEGRKLSKNESVAQDIVGKLTYSKDTWKDISTPAASLKQITEDANKFDYEDEFFHHLKDITPRYPFSYGNEIDESVNNDIKGMGVYGLRDTWRKVGGSYGSAPNIISSTKNQGFEVSSAGQVGLGGLSEEGADHLINNLKINELRHRAGMGGFKLPSIDPLTGKEISGETNTNQQESDILIDLIKQAREQKTQALAQNIENIKKKVNAQIEAESSLEKGIPLKGMDAKLAKTNENLYARIKNPRLSDDKLPFPVQGFRGEFTQEAEAAPITRPTIAMQEARAKKNEIFNAGAGEREENRQFQVDNLKFKMKEEAERHSNEGDVLRGTSSLYNEENESFGGPFKNLPGFYEKGPQNELQRVTAYKKNQIQSGKTDPLAQRLHTQIAKTIASYKEPKMDFDHPEVYERYLKQVDISKLGDVKKLSSVSLKSYADENIPVLNPAIMALQEYYDSVNERRFGFNNTEDFARTIQNKNIELAAKMDREAAMLIARKVRGEVKKESPEIYTEPSKDMNRLMKLYKTYNQAVGIKWQGADDDLIHAGDPPNKRMIDQSMGKHDYQSKNKDYHNIYDQIDIIANDMNYIGENLSVKNEFSIPVYEKVKRDQAALESFIKDKIQKASQGSRNIAVQDFLERQKKEKPAEAAKVIAEEQAKPVVAAPAEQAKPNPAVVAVEQAKPPMSGDRQNPPEDQIAKQDDAKRRMLTSYVSLVQDNPLYWEGTKDEEDAHKKYNDIFSRFREGTPISFKYYIARQPNQKGKKAEMDDMIKPIDQSSRNIKALSRLGQGGVFSATGDLTNEFMKSNTESRKEKIKKEEEIVRSMGGEKDDVFFEQFARNTLSVANNLTKVPVVPLFNTGGPVAYRSVGGSIDTMLTPKEKVFSPRKVAQIESRSPGLLSHINSGGKVKHLSLGGQASFTVPDHAPNPKGIPSANTDTVYARLETGSFVVNAKSSIENASLLQHLASGGSVGYYADGGNFDKSGYPTDKNEKYVKGLTDLQTKIYKNRKNILEPLKEKFNLDDNGLISYMNRIASESNRQNNAGRVGGIVNEDLAVYNEIMFPQYANFKSFLNSGLIEKAKKDYRAIEDKKLKNFIETSKELKSSDSYSKNLPISLPNNKISKKGPTEEQLIRMERNANNAKSILPNLENSKKGPNQEDLLVMDQNLTETKNFQAGRNETSKKGPTEEELVRMERNAKEQRDSREESNRTYKVGPTKRESITMQQNAEKNKQIQRLKSPEMQEKERLNKITESKNINARKIELENLKKKLEESKNPFGDLTEYRRISKEIDVKNKEYNDLIEKSRINKNDFNLLPLGRNDFNLLPLDKNDFNLLSVPGFADGGEIDFSKIQKLKTAMPNPNDMQKVQKALKKRKYQDPNEMQKLKTALPEMMTKKLSTVTDFQKRTETFSPEILKMFEAPEELQKVKSVAPKGYADGGAVGYYDIGGRVNAIANKLDAQKRKSEKQQGLNYDVFERHMENKQQKILNFNDMPKLLKDNKEIDKTYLTKMKHFEPNYTVGLDPKIAKNFMNQLKSKNIKGVAGPNADFNNANYFGEIGKIFNLTDTFLRNQDVTALHESLDLKTKNRVDLEQGVSGEIIAIDKPLEQARNLKKQNGGLFPRLKAFEFMKQYGAVDKDGKPIHTAITARADFFNPNAGPNDNLDLGFKLRGRQQPVVDAFVNDNIGKPRRFEQGGHVNGASDGDTIPAFLSAGEFVMPRHAVNRIGLGNLEKMRKPQRFYDGGAVGSSGGSVFDKMNNVANNQSANSIDVDSLNNAAREFNKAAKSFETSMAKMEKSVSKLEGTMDKLSKVNIPDNITGNITVNNQATVTIDSPDFLKDINTAVGKAVSDITGRLNDVSEGKIDIRDIRNA